MGGISSSLEGYSSIQSNAAGAVWKEETFGLISYRSPFLIRELSEKSVSIGKSIKGKSLNASLTQEGDSRLTEQNIILNYAQRFGKELAIGIGLNYYNMAFSDIYGSRKLFYTTSGFQLLICLCCFLLGYPSY